jgi:glucose-6-phosphate 1-dehydrogenase
MEKPICLITGATEGFGKLTALELAGKGFTGVGEAEPNVITLRIQPDDGICLQFGVKPPGLTADLAKVAMRFRYEDAFGKSSANGYERLLLDAILGDATLFSHRDGVEATWALFTPILDAWAKNPDTSFPNYSAGAWGPSKVATPLSDEAPGPDLISIEDMRFVQMEGR